MHTDKDLSGDFLIERLKWRYATKEFDATKTIAAELWQSLEQSLVLTPSSFGLQLWHFYVITQKELRQELFAHSWRQSQVLDCSHYLVLCTPKEITEKHVERFLQHAASVRQVELSSLDGYREVLLGFLQNLSSQERLIWAQKQSYIALGQAMCAAALMGIDACPMEGFSAPEYDRILNLGERNLTTAVCCAFGYRSQEDAYAKHPKVRFEPSELITHL